MNKSRSTTNHLFSSRLTTVVSIALVILLIGITSSLLLMANELSVFVKENLTLTIVLKNNVKDADIKKMQKTLDAFPYTKSTEFIDKETAAKELSESLGGTPLDFLDFNPLSGSIEMSLFSDYANNDSIATIEKEIYRIPQVKEVIYQKNLVEEVNANVQRISIVLLSFSALLLLISFILVSNTVRLGVYSKRFLIHTMKLVGATGSFIRKPFMVQAVVTGVIAAIFAIGMMSVMLYSLLNEFQYVLTTETLNLLLISFVVMVFFGIIITSIATYFSVNKYLRLNVDDMYYI